MNTTLVMYNNCINKFSNDSNLYIIGELFNDPSWNKYKNFYNATYSGVLNYLLEMSLITKITYTYYVSKEEIYEISPYYIKSLYQEMDFNDKFKRTKRHEKTIHQFKTSKILKKYLDIYELGHSFVKDKKIAYSTTKYKITDELKKLSLSLSSSDFLVIDSKNLSKEKGKINFITDRPKYYSNVEYYLKMNGLYRTTFDSINTNQCKEFQKQINYDLTNTVKVNRKYIESCLSDPNIYKNYQPHIVHELQQIYNYTTDSNIRYNLYYNKTNCGRYYCKDSLIQMFPKELRNSVLLSYTEVDMCSSIFCLYVNLAETFDYSGNISELKEFVKDPKEYRNKFVTDKLYYNDVKKILTTIAYGVRTNIYNMYLELYNSDKLFYKNSILSDTADKLSVINMVNTDKIQELIKEIHLLGKFLIKKHTYNKKIRNVYGSEISINGSFGKKMAHIMQSYESKILLELSNTVINNKKLKDIQDSIGLYLHDGLYINNNILKNIDICKEFSNHIKNVLGFNISYSID